MRARLRGARNWRWDLIGVGAFTLVLFLATTTRSAYFLHLDAPNQDYAAVAWARGCWEYSTEKMLGVLLLAPLFRFFGPTPLWEIALLQMLAAVSVTAVYELARLLANSRLAGLLAALLVLSLPAFQYFSRTHLGYVMPCLLLAWLAVWHKRWAWAGLFFGLTLIAHFGYSVIVGVSVIALAAFWLRPTTWRTWLAFGLAGLTPWLLVEALFFTYMGRPFQWTRGTLAVGLNWSGASAVTWHPNWFWTAQTAVASNGWLLAAVLAMAPFTPLAVRRDKVGIAMSITFIGAVLVYAFVALRHSIFVSRPLGPLYPFWAVGAAVVSSALLRWLPWRSVQQTASGLTLAGLAMAVVQSGIFIQEFTQTPFPTVGQWIQAAGQAGRPVRYNNAWVGLFYAQIYGAEMLTQDADWIKDNAPGQAVLIFEYRAPEGLNGDGYRIESADVSAVADSLYPALTKEAAIPRHVELWWPSGPSSPVKPQGRLPQFAQYYSGSGCVSPPAFGNGTLHFYQLVWRKVLNGFRK